jgi:hypothetical protein
MSSKSEIKIYSTQTWNCVMYYGNEDSTFEMKFLKFFAVNQEWLAFNDNNLIYVEKFLETGPLVSKV